MIETDAFTAPLTAIVREAGFPNAVVTVTGAPSVGATRATLFIDIESEGQRTPAVAQVGSLLDTGSAAAEAALLLLADSAGVPVAKVVAATNQSGIEASDVLITTRVEGLSVPRQILRSIGTAVAGDELAQQCGSALAKLHSLGTDAAPSSIDRLDPVDPHGDYCRRLEESLDVLPTHHPTIRWGINCLRRNPPGQPPRQSIVHGDFRNGNMLVAEGQLTAILDWELAHVGDPMEDLAWMCVRMWRFGSDDRPVGGFGSIDALRVGYESAGGEWRQDAFDWWLAARSAWWAIGLAGQGAAFLSGASTSIVHAASGRRVPELEYDLMTLIRAMET